MLENQGCFCSLIHDTSPTHRLTPDNVMPQGLPWYLVAGSNLSDDPFQGVSSAAENNGKVGVGLAHEVERFVTGRLLV